MNFGDINITLTKKGWLAVTLGLIAAIFIFLLAWTLGLIAFLTALLFGLIQLLWALLVWLFAQLGLTALLTTVIGWLTATFTALTTWLASTWLGGLILPLLSKIAPFLTAGNLGKTLWKKAKTLQKKSEEELPLEIKQK